VGGDYGGYLAWAGIVMVSRCEVGIGRGFVAAMNYNSTCFGGNVSDWFRFGTEKEVWAR
jgi:hypothetical protein